MKVSTENDNNFGYEKITIVVDNIPLSSDCQPFPRYMYKKQSYPPLTSKHWTTGARHNINKNFIQSMIKNLSMCNNFSYQGLYGLVYGV